MGTVCAGWQLGRVALAARRAESGGGYAADYLQGLIALVRFHAHMLGVQAGAHAAAVVGAGETAAAFDSVL